MSNQRTVAELLDAYMDQEKMHNMEGRRGMEHLCQIAGALGYKDPQRHGQLTSKATVGDLLAMLEDNSGMIETMVDWIRSRNFSEFRDPLEAAVRGEIANAYEDGVCPDCGEDIPPNAVRGEACNNCGHVFNPEVSDD